MTETVHTIVNNDHTDTSHTGISIDTGSNHSEVISHSTENTGHLEHAISLPAEPVIQIKGFEISNALLTSWVVVLFLVILSIVLRAKLKTIPGRLQGFFEVLFEGGLDLCDQVTGDRKLSQKVFPIVFTFFIFILLSNWIGLLPLTSIGIDHYGVFVPFLRSGTADINTTIAFAFIAVLGSNIFGAIIVGVWKTFNKYINLTGLWTAIKNIKKEPVGPLVAFISFFVGIIEIIGEAAKVASLSFRLFGNVFAGEVLLVSISGLVGILAPVPFIFLEVLVGVVQAVVFSMLTLVYFTIASHDHGHDNHEEHHGDFSTEDVHEIVDSENKHEETSHVFVPAK